MKIDLKKYTNKTSGRFRDSGNYSGEWFLEDILWPNIDICIKENSILEIDFNDVEITPQFIDQCFSQLIVKYNFKDTNKYLKFICNDKNIILDILAAIVGAEFKTFKKVYTNIWK